MADSKAHDPLDHDRARAAVRRLSTRFPAGKVDCKKLKRYRSVVLSAPASLRQAGLLQLATFWVSKTGEEHDLLEDVLHWLVECRVTAPICREDPKVTTAPCVATLGALFARSGAKVALLEGEAELFLGWMKRLVEGLWKDEDCEAQLSTAAEEDASAGDLPPGGDASPDDRVTE